jgi:hypothetical protein
MTSRSAGQYDPYRHADRLGIRVVHGSIRSANGLWIAEDRLIILKRGLRTWHERQVLTHELAHCCLGHGLARVTARDEFLADRWAARKLITPGSLADIAQTTPDPGVWAIELGVTDHLLHLHLTGSRLYPEATCA